ncbi:hypothetical protein TNCV_2030361 [Trichonephila clavipes]|nr:hypothetical protein TNCV_2030361 [Trichonephila clavipes]
MELTQQDSLQAEIVVPVVTKKPRVPPFFVSPKGDWRQLVALAKLVAPFFQSQMSGRFLKVTVSDEVEYRDLSRWLENSGVEFKSFMLKQDRQSRSSYVAFLQTPNLRILRLKLKPKASKSLRYHR